jgi:hypothetical protein
VSTKQKVLLIGLAVVLVVLFVVAVGGGDPGEGNARGHHSFLNKLAKLGGKRANLPPELVTGDCVKPDHTLALNGPCVLHVADPGSMKLLVLTGLVPFAVTAPAPGDADYTASDDVKPDDTGVARTEIAIDKASEVLVTCGGLSGTCVLTIGDK